MIYTPIKLPLLKPDSLMYNSANQMSDSASQRDGTQSTTQSSHYLWIVLPLVTGVAVIQGLMGRGLPVLYPFIQDEFGLSRAQVGLISSFMAAGFAVSVIFAGWLTDTFGVKRIVTIAMLMVTAFIFAFPLAYSFPLILGLVVIIGIARSPIGLATAQIVINWFPVKVRAFVMSVRMMGIPIAGALTAAVLPTLAAAIGWRMAIAVTGLLVLVIAIAFILLYRDVPQDARGAPKFNIAVLKTLLWNRGGLVITIVWGATLIGLSSIAM